MKEKVQIDEIYGNWAHYMEKLPGQNQELWELMRENPELVLNCREKGNAALRRLPETVTVCHNDMNSNLQG